MFQCFPYENLEDRLGFKLKIEEIIALVLYLDLLNLTFRVRHINRGRGSVDEIVRLQLVLIRHVLIVDQFIPLLLVLDLLVVPLFLVLLLLLHHHLLFTSLVLRL
jgi:hypothetical protein